MAATNIGTAPALSDERVRQLLGAAIAHDGSAGDEIRDIISAHEIARLSQEALDLRTSIGILTDHADRIEQALETANEVIASLGRERIVPRSP